MTLLLLDLTVIDPFAAFNATLWQGSHGLRFKTLVLAVLIPLLTLFIVLVHHLLELALLQQYGGLKARCVSASLKVPFLL